MLFKYWFALDIDDTPRRETLQPSHLGLLLFIKARVGKRVVSRLELDTDAARTAHLNCAACGKTLKDWGGKKHLMNPRGAAPSDVWRDLPRRKIADNVIPKDVLARVTAMSLTNGRVGLHVVQSGVSALTAIHRNDDPRSGVPAAAGDLSSIEPDTVHHGDCVSFLKRVTELHPEGWFDLAFADPPYNLAKDYGDYGDERADQHYLDWCNEWLAGMAGALKPGGSLFVLNLPKWALHHASFLDGWLEFRHWIVWDALSDPRGKIMPAHYALLWYTKPGGKPLCNYATLPKSGRGTASSPDAVPSPDAPRYCLRAACIRDRKTRGDDEKVELTDVWFDVHRIKHKRDRDAHPCQLPDKLMERIIKLTTHRGGWVFDPFGGAGTTAIAAAKLGRRFVITEMDGKYVSIAREKLGAMKQHADLFGELTVPRLATVKRKQGASKREVELYVQELAKRLGRVPDENDVAADNATMLAKMDAIYPYRAAALKRAKVVLADRI
jgi:site-specific DNA-methyltransferase (adenine-specific)